MTQNRNTAVGIFILQIMVLSGLFLGASYRNFGVKEWTLFIFGGILAGWAFLEMNINSRFHFLPTARQGASLLRHGPYRWFRHPMYTGIGYMGFSVALARCDWIRCSCLVAYLVVMEVKMRIEEADLREKFEDYPQFQRKTSRWIPGVY